MLAPRKNYTLPVELLEEVFLFGFARAQNAQPARPTRRHRIRLPFRVAAVCRLWRCIALTTPALWSDIVIDMCAFKCAQTQHAYLDLLLERSKSCALDIYIYYVSDAGPMHLRGEFEPHLLLQLGRVTRRWRRLHMSLPAGCIGGYPHPLHMFTQHTPLLEELCLDFCLFPTSRLRHAPIPQNYLPHCPRLRVLVLQNTSHALAILPWPYLHRGPLALVELDVRTAGISPDVQLAILQLAPHLAVLRVCDFHRYNLAITAPQVDVSLPFLKDLSLPGIPAQLLAEWAPSLNLENIASLDLTGQRFAELEATLSHVRDTVTMLSFTLEGGDLCPASHTVLFDWMTRLTRLRVLRIASTGLMAPQRFFRAVRERRVASLGQPAVETSVWPELRVLQLRDAHDEAASGSLIDEERAAQALFDLVVSRNAPRGPVRDGGRTAPPVRLTHVALLGYHIEPSILAGIRVLVPVRECRRDGPWLSVAL